MKIIIVVIMVVFFITILLYKEKPKKPKERQVVFEFNIKNDPQWKKFWDLFMSSCVEPLEPPINLNSSLYKECFEPPDTKKYDRHEIAYKKRTTSSIKLSPQWAPLMGKYRRDSTETERCIDELKRIELGKNIQWRGNFYYPPGGYREWHTNKYDPSGWRMYVVHVEGESYFNYIHPDTGELKKCKDEDGTVRIFHLSSHSPLWHCVASKGKRYSLGAMWKK